MVRSETAESGSDAISVNGICKAFGPTVALSGATFTVPPGSVHALLGENGAGKSTLIKIISGMLQPDNGTIIVDGRSVELKDRRVAKEQGIATAFQELTLVKDLTVAQNLLMPNEPRNALGLVSKRLADERVAAHLESIGIRNMSPRAEVAELTLPERQKLEIARAVLSKPRILLLDEPTSALSGPDIDWLGNIIEAQRQAGTAVLFISHRLSEVRQYCDQITILRNGKSVGTFDCDAIGDEQVIEMIIGRSLQSMFPPKVSRSSQYDTELLRVDRLNAGKATDVTFALRRGEILGVAALQGMGQLDLFRALSGDLEVASGSITVGSEQVVFNSPHDAIESAIGVSFLPEERKTEALFLKKDGRFNSTLPILDRYAKFGVPDRVVEEAAVAAAFEEVQVTLRAMNLPMSSFSGGNQQKVVMAKWFMADSKIMLLFDPTRGVDVGTKYEIYVLLNRYAEKGGAILLYSTEIDEVLNLCHRVIVMYDGKVAKMIESESGPISEHEVMRAALGGGTNKREENECHDHR